MPLVPFGLGSYRRADLPQIRLVNLFAEQAPTAEGKVALLPRPALAPFMTVGDGPIRGLFGQDGVLGGSLFTLSANTLYRDGNVVGVVSGSGISPMVAADSAILIASGNLYRSDGASVMQIAFPDNAGVTDLAYLGGYAVAARAGSRRLYFTLDSTTWDGLDYVSAEQSPAPIVGLQVVAGQLWVFSTDHVEVFYLTGSSDAPLAALPGRVFDKGCRERATIAFVDNTAFWVGGDRIVYRGAGSPVRVSDHGIEERIRDSSLLVGFAYTWVGHSFYGLQLDDGTFVYDAATEQWHELGSFGVPRWRGGVIARVGYVQTVGDFFDNRLWRFTDDAHTDNGDPIVAEFTVLENEAIFIDNVTVNCSTGETAVDYDTPGTLEMRVSRDGGQLFGDWRQTSLGRTGRYRTRAAFRRIGKVDQDNLVMQFRLTDNVPRRISEVRINDALGARSR